MFLVIFFSSIDPTIKLVSTSGKKVGVKNDEQKMIGYLKIYIQLELQFQNVHRNLFADSLYIFFLGGGASIPASHNWHARSPVFPSLIDLLEGCQRSMKSFCAHQGNC